MLLYYSHFHGNQEYRGLIRFGGQNFWTIANHYSGGKVRVRQNADATCLAVEAICLAVEGICLAVDATCLAVEAMYMLGWGVYMLCCGGYMLGYVGSIAKHVAYTVWRPNAWL
jgi:hypothetical protein